MTKRILHVVTNRNQYDDPSHPTGLWLSELTHAWDIFEEAGYEQQLVSPQGGKVPLEPRALKRPYLDASAKAWQANPERMALLTNTPSPADIDASQFDAIYFTGGHAVMYDFPDDAGLQQLARDIYQQDGVVSSVCHGYCGLLNITLSNGQLLVANRKLTGFSWCEEVLAGVAKLVPYNVQEEMIKRGAKYQKRRLPFTSNVVVNGRLVTEQNPQSAKATANAVVAVLEKTT